MSWYISSKKNDYPEITQVMEAWFQKRTKLHIDRVKKFCKKIFEYDSKRFENLIKRSESIVQQKLKYSG